MMDPLPIGFRVAVNKPLVLTEDVRECLPRNLSYQSIVIKSKMFEITGRKACDFCVTGENHIQKKMQKNRQADTKRKQAG